MMQGNYRNRPVLLIGLAILFFLLLSLIPGGTKVGPVNLKQIDPFMDIKPDSLLSNSFNEFTDPVLITYNDEGKSYKVEEIAGAFDLSLLYDAGTSIKIVLNWFN